MILQGILGTVSVSTFNDARETTQVLRNWTITSFPFDNHVDLENLVRSQGVASYEISPDGILYDGPVVLHGEIEISPSQQIHDTYFEAEGWGKGFVFVNGFNIGRFWPSVGPQITMYVPKDLLKHGKNDFYIVELQKVPFNQRMSFVNGPIFINDQKS